MHLKAALPAEIDYDSELNKESEKIKKKLEELEAQDERTQENGESPLKEDEDGLKSSMLAKRGSEQLIGQEDDPDSEQLLPLEDTEANQYILSAKETQIKTLIWNNLHKDWVREQEIKEKTTKSEKGTQRNRGIGNSKGYNSRIVFTSLTPFMSLWQE